MLGAPLDEVWSTGAADAFLRREAPGSGSRREQREQREQREPKLLVRSQRQLHRGGRRCVKEAPGGACPLPRRRSRQPSTAPPPDPLCDLYTRGYSATLNDTMAQRSPLEDRSCFGEEGAADGWSPPDGEDPFVRQFRGLVDATDDGAPGARQRSSRAGYGPIDFFNEDDEADAASTASTNGDSNDGSSVDTEHGDGRRRGSKGVESYSNAVEEAYDVAADGGGDIRRHTALHQHQQQQQQQQQHKHQQPSATTFVVDMSLYIVSGVVLIFLMEQFIQVGMRIRAS